MPISFGLTSNLSISQNLSVGGTAAIGSSLTLSDTTASSLLYGNASKVVSSVTLASNLSLTTGTLALATALTSINSVTAASATGLTLTGGSSGASLVLGATASGNLSLRPANGIVKVTEGAGATSILQIPVAFGNAYMIGGNLNGGADAKYSYVAFQAQTMQFGRVNDALSSFTESGRFSSTGNLLIGTTTDMASTAGGLTVAATGSGATATGVNTGGLRSANFGLSTVSGGASYFGGNLSVSTSSNGGGIVMTGSGVGGPFIVADATNATVANRFAGLALKSGGVAQWSVGIRAGDGALHFADTVTSRAVIRATGDITFTPQANVNISAGALTIASTTPSTGVGTGALQVAGGIYAGAASVFAGNISVAGNSSSFGDYSTNNYLRIGAQSGAISGIKLRPTASDVGAYGFTLQYNGATSDFSILRHEFSEAGTAALTIARATGAATFAGAVTTQGLFYPQQATTAGAPAYVKGAIYFDTTLNKLRVGGATTWETLTSV